jgi:hypothetical protein
VSSTLPFLTEFAANQILYPNGVLIAKWLLEYDPEARVLIITDRDELDKQIEGVMRNAGVIGAESPSPRITSRREFLEKLSTPQCYAVKICMRRPMAPSDISQPLHLPLAVKTGKSGLAGQELLHGGLTRRFASLLCISAPCLLWCCLTLTCRKHVFTHRGALPASSNLQTSSIHLA